MSKLPSYIHFTSEPSKVLAEVIEELEPDKIAVLVDENTREHCLPRIEFLEGAAVIEIRSGEREKNLSTCDTIWTEMTSQKFTRKSVLINLGGGVIGDMGGFAASTYKRGIRFINMPTTLLSQVDASIGGKLGIDFKGLKNHIGVFNDPNAVILWDGFLETLSSRELRSGYAEVIKHGLIWDQEYWQRTVDADFPEKVDWPYLLRRSVEIKGEVVNEDPLEKGLRKILNFGHTIGHAVETWHLESGRDILHGEAVAAGMIMEAKLSELLRMLPSEQTDNLAQYLVNIYGKIQELPTNEELFELMAQDKKNEGTNIMFSLINQIGECTYDTAASEGQISSAIAYYRDFPK
ncbi:MAG: 3-dehydroquinate synthase [Cyclobacteriaceae bacterium]